jgi:hypothetical protein
MSLGREGSRCQLLEVLQGLDQLLTNQLFCFTSKKNWRMSFFSGGVTTDNTRAVEVPPSVACLWNMKWASSSIGSINLSHDGASGLCMRRMSLTISLTSVVECGGARSPPPPKYDSRDSSKATHSCLGGTLWRFDRTDGITNTLLD